MQSVLLVKSNEGQFRKGIAKEPYVVHLEEVASFVTAWRGTKDAITGAWLHDTIEDCPPTNFDEIASLFGKKIALIVLELTDDKSLPKQERKDLQITNASKKSLKLQLLSLLTKLLMLGPWLPPHLRIGHSIEDWTTSNGLNV